MPVAPRERLVTLDVLRGFAMYGVVLSNLYMLYSLRFAQRPAPSDGLLDALADGFLRIVVASKAQTLLAFLFGFGFAAQLLRARSSEERVWPLYLRRLFTLFVLGWFHVLVIAWVDVTWGYALTALLLLPFIRCSTRTLVIVATAFTIIPAVVYTIPEVRPAMHFLLFDRPPPRYIGEFLAAVKSGDRVDILRMNAVLGVMWTLGGSGAWYLPWLLVRFLLGFIAGSRRWFDKDGADNLPMFRKWLGIGALVALPAIVLQVLEMTKTFVPHEYELPLQMVLHVVSAFGLLGQTAIYVAMVILMMQRATWRKLLGVLAPVGRMPLTTYMMQSLICTSLFYGWGLGWSTPSPAACIGLASAIFAVQIAFAHLWLRWFQFGPVEWMWRSIVYLRAQPMRSVSTRT